MGAGMTGLVCSAGTGPDTKTTQGRWPSYIPCVPEIFTGPIPHAPMESSTRIQVTRAGVSFGSTLAIAISWSVNHSILWACLHGVMSWIYVVYFALTR